MSILFDGILIYNKTWDAHIKHGDKALHLLWDHLFFIKHSKYSFGFLEVKYLGHIVQQDEVRGDPKKIVNTRMETP